MKARQLAIPATLSARRHLADRAGLLVAVGFYVIVVSVLAGLWRVAASGAPGGTIAGYSGLALTWYIATSEAAICTLNIRLIEQIGDDIASGAIAVELLRPFSVVAVRLAVEFGRASGRLLVLIAAGVLLSLVAAGAPPDPAAALLAVPALALAVAANLALQHAVAGAAFWLRDTRSSWFIYQKFVFILGGLLLPLQVLPDGLQAVAMKLPFMAVAYVPARLAAGYFEPELLLLQVFWLAVLFGAAAAVFAAGERRLQVVGG